MCQDTLFIGQRRGSWNIIEEQAISPYLPKNPLNSTLISTQALFNIFLSALSVSPKYLSIYLFHSLTFPFAENSCFTKIAKIFVYSAKFVANF